MRSPHPADRRAERRSVVRADRAAARRRREVRRHVWVLSIGLALLLVAGVAAAGLLAGPFTSVPASAGQGGEVTAPSSPPAAATSPLAATSPPPTEAPATTAPRRPVLRVAGDYPTEGSGEFDIHPDSGPRHGTSGPLRRFRVAVEEGADETVEKFAGVVDAALGDPRSWPARGELRLQRVGAGSSYDFTIYLATQATAGRMCAAGGVNINIGGVPYTSCRVGGKVIVNLTRWLRSVPDYVRADVPLEDYRLYVVNHEVGHQLGRGHQGCPGRGRPAPVMQQQTLGLSGCRANSWPYPDAGD